MAFKVFVSYSSPPTPVVPPAAPAARGPRAWVVRTFGAFDWLVIRAAPSLDTLRAQSVESGGPEQVGWVEREHSGGLGGGMRFVDDPELVLGADPFRPCVGMVVARASLPVELGAPVTPNGLVSHLAGALRGRDLAISRTRHTPKVLPILGFSGQLAVIVRADTFDTIAELAQGIRSLRVPSFLVAPKNDGDVGATPGSAVWCGQRTTGSRLGPLFRSVRTVVGVPAQLSHPSLPLSVPAEPDVPVCADASVVLHARFAGRLRHLRGPRDMWSERTVNRTLGASDEIVRLVPAKLADGTTPVSWRHISAALDLISQPSGIDPTARLLLVASHAQRVHHIEEPSPTRLERALTTWCDNQRNGHTMSQGWASRWSATSERSGVPPVLRDATRRLILAILQLIEDDPAHHGDLVNQVNGLLRIASASAGSVSNLFSVGQEDRCIDPLRVALDSLRSAVSNRLAVGAEPWDRAGPQVLSGIQGFSAGLAGFVAVVADSLALDGPPLIVESIGTGRAAEVVPGSFPVLRVNASFALHPRSWVALCHELGHLYLDRATSTRRESETASFGACSWTDRYTNLSRRLLDLGYADFESPALRPLAGALVEVHADLIAASIVSTPFGPGDRVAETWNALRPALVKAFREELWGGVRDSLRVRELVVRAFFTTRALQRRLVPIAWAVDLAQVCDDLLQPGLEQIVSGLATNDGASSDAALLKLLDGLRADTAVPGAIWRFSLGVLREDLLSLHPANSPDAERSALRSVVDEWVVELTEWCDLAAPRIAEAGDYQPYREFLRSPVSGGGAMAGGGGGHPDSIHRDAGPLGDDTESVVQVVALYADHARARSSRILIDLLDTPLTERVKTTVPGTRS